MFDVLTRKHYTCSAEECLDMPRRKTGRPYRRSKSALASHDLPTFTHALLCSTLTKFNGGCSPLTEANAIHNHTLVFDCGIQTVIALFVLLNCLRSTCTIIRVAFRRRKTLIAIGAYNIETEVDIFAHAGKALLFLVVTASAVISLENGHALTSPRVTMTLGMALIRGRASYAFAEITANTNALAIAFVLACLLRHIVARLVGGGVWIAALSCLGVTLARLMARGGRLTSDISATICLPDANTSDALVLDGAAHTIVAWSVVWLRRLRARSVLPAAGPNNMARILRRALHTLAEVRSVALPADATIINSVAIAVITSCPVRLEHELALSTRAIAPVEYLYSINHPRSHRMALRSGALHALAPIPPCAFVSFARADIIDREGIAVVARVPLHPEGALGASPRKRVASAGLLAMALRAHHRCTLGLEAVHVIAGCNGLVVRASTDDHVALAVLSVPFDHLHLAAMGVVQAGKVTGLKGRRSRDVQARRTAPPCNADFPELERGCEGELRFGIRRSGEKRLRNWSAAPLQHGISKEVRLKNLKAPVRETIVCSNWIRIALWDKLGRNKMEVRAPPSRLRALHVPLLRIIVREGAHIQLCAVAIVCEEFGVSVVWPDPIIAICDRYWNAIVAARGVATSSVSLLRWRPLLMPFIHLFKFSAELSGTAVADGLRLT